MNCEYKNFNLEIEGNNTAESLSYVPSLLNHNRSFLLCRDGRSARSTYLKIILEKKSDLKNINISTTFGVNSPNNFRISFFGENGLLIKQHYFGTGSDNTQIDYIPNVKSILFDFNSNIGNGNITIRINTLSFDIEVNTKREVQILSKKYEEDNVIRKDYIGNLDNCVLSNVEILKSSQPVNNSINQSLKVKLNAESAFVVE